jgi:general secretion pathway protein D
MTIATYSRQALSVLQALLLCCAPSLVEAASPAQAPASPPQTAAQEDKFELSPRPNPKYAQKISELGEKALADGHLDEALNYFEQAARYAPQDTTLIERIASMRSKLVRAHVEAAERDALAGHADVATEELAKALLIDPGNTIVAERMMQMKAMKDEPLAVPDQQIDGIPQLNPRAGKQNINLRGDSKAVYEQLGQLFGIKVTFDPDLAAKPVHLRLDDIDFTTALKILSVETGTFSRPLTSTLLFVAQDTQEKRRQYAAEAKQSFLLPASVAPEEMTELGRVLKEMTGSTRVELDTRSRTITMRDTPERLALAGALIRQAEKTRGEVLLEIEILEVDRNKARDLGLLPPSSAELISLTPSLIGQLKAAQDVSTLITLLASIFGSGGTSGSAGTSLSSLIPPLVLVGGGKTTFLLTTPAVAAQFSDALSLVHSGTQVLLRAQDGKPASFFVGDRYPITLSLLSGSLGASTAATSVGSVTGSLLPSASYNVGIGPVSLTSADFRNVGLQDLAVVNEIDNTLTILQNQGSGTFLQAGSPISLGAARTVAPTIAPSIASAVLTTSGFHDLVVTDPVANTVEVQQWRRYLQGGHRFAHHRRPRT